MTDEAQVSPSPSATTTNTPSPTATLEPTPTPTGGTGTIVYTALDGSIHLATLDASGSVSSTPLEVGTGAFPAWSPDGSLLAFLRIQGDPDSVGIISAELHIADISGDGSSRKLAVLRYPQLAEASQAPALFPYNHFFWSPDSEWLAYLDYVGHDDSFSRRVYFEVRVISASGGDSVLLAETTFSWDDHGFLYSPLAWSPDSTKIAYASYDDENHGLFLINADGSHEIRLAAIRYAHSVNWIPDGTSILFVEDPHDGSGIPHIGGSYAETPYLESHAGHLMRVALDGTAPERLTTERVYEPVVSPDGLWVAYVERFNRVMALPLEGGDAIEVALACTYRGDSFQLAWSPDSELLALLSATASADGGCRFDWYGIHVYTLQGTEVVRLGTPWGGYSFSPDSSFTAVSGLVNLMISNLEEGSITYSGSGRAIWPAWQPAADYSRVSTRIDPSN
jgi:Tol biopolymer transport system component